MTTPDPNREPGYRGSLPTREDHLARPWILLVIATFVLILVLSVLGVPSRFAPEPTPTPTPVPLPSLPAATESAEPTPSVEASPTPEASPEASPTT